MPGHWPSAPGRSSGTLAEPVDDGVRVGLTDTALRVRDAACVALVSVRP